MNYKPVSDHNYEFKHGDFLHKEKGTWRILSYRNSDRTAAAVRCGNCGAVLLLNENHTISEDGQITPSVGCGFCGWHVFGRLVDWNLKGGGS